MKAYILLFALIFSFSFYSCDANALDISSEIRSDDIAHREGRNPQTGATITRPATQANEPRDGRNPQTGECSICFRAACICPTDDD